jgi:hypothetical protein
MYRFPAPGTTPGSTPTTPRRCGARWGGDPQKEIGVFAYPRKNHHSKGLSKNLSNMEYRKSPILQEFLQTHALWPKT